MEYSVASRKRRITAFLIDSWCFGLLSLIAGYTLISTLQFSMHNPWFNEPIMQGAIGLFSYCVFTAKDSFRGASLGKWITGVQVINLNDQKPASALSCFIRNLSQIVWPIEAVFMTLNSNKRRIGDYLANTQVVISKSMPVYIRAISFIIVLFLYQLSPDLPELKPSSFDFDQFSKYVIKQTQAYDIAEQALYEQSEIQKIIGPILTIKIVNNSQVHINNEAGEANFWFKVLGEKAEIPVFISLQRQQSQWEIKSIKYEQVIPIPIIN